MSRYSEKWLDKQLDRVRAGVLALQAQFAKEQERYVLKLPAAQAQHRELVTTAIAEQDIANRQLQVSVALTRRTESLGASSLVAWARSPAGGAREVGKLARHPQENPLAFDGAFKCRRARAAAAAQPGGKGRFPDALKSPLAAFTALTRVTLGALASKKGDQPKAQRWHTYSVGDFAGLAQRLNMLAVGLLMEGHTVYHYESAKYPPGSACWHFQLSDAHTEDAWRYLPQVQPWGVFDREAKRSVRVSEKLIESVLRDVARAHFPLTCSEAQWTARRRAFFNEVLEKLDLLKRYPPSGFDERIDVVPAGALGLGTNEFVIPEEPEWFSEARSWPQRRFESPWEVLQREMCQPELGETGEKLLLGTDLSGQVPLVIERSSLTYHLAVDGSSGSYKTSGLLLPLTMQLMRGAEKNPVLFLDGKGDIHAWHMLRREALALGRRVHFVSPSIENQPDGRNARRTDSFDFFSCIEPVLGDRPAELANLVTQALELEHGSGYGRSFFSGRSRQLLAKMLAHPSKPRSFGELVKLLPSDVAREKVEELADTLHGLSSGEVARVLRARESWEPEDSALDMHAAVERGDLIYCYLPPSSSQAASAVARLLMHTFKEVVSHRNQRQRPQRRGYVVGDEFQRFAGLQFVNAFQQAGGLGTSFLVGVQTPSSLDAIERGFASTVFENCNTCITTSVATTDRLKHFQEMSGDRVVVSVDVVHGGSSTRGTSRTQSHAEMEGRTSSNSRTWGVMSAQMSGLTNSFSERMGPYGWFPQGTTNTEGGNTGSSNSTQFGGGVNEGRTWSHSKVQGVGVSEAQGQMWSEVASRVYRPVFEPNEILDASATPLGCIVWIRNGGPNGGRPFAARLMHASDAETFELIEQHGFWPTEDRPQQPPSLPAPAPEPAPPQNPAQEQEHEPEPEGDDFIERLFDLTLDDELGGGES